MIRRLLPFVLLTMTLSAASPDFDKKVEDHYANHDGVKIHYVTIGKGPLIVMVHGWPDFWYTWRNQMEALAPHYRIAAMDLRGFNLSDKPKGVENYDMKLLVGDVAAVIKDAGGSSAIVIGHDWGGMISWQLAMARPELVDKLVILNLPHPRGLARELVHNPEQAKNSQYARNNQQPDAASKLTAEGLARWVQDPAAKAKYVEAFKRSDFEAMMNYYKANYPKEPYREDPSPVVKVKASVLQIHGLADTALLPGALNNTWDYLDKDWTLVTIPGAGHFVQQDASDLVTRSIVAWLNR
ncbi:MAG TPA: alpha/beta hydrolase [Bryobacteraceae bacterium]|jgi:pimeloyl-ACP methyl ester carboxylesterase|nr:alpha/beta hydrolase [Bryobacteraceae bacterium]